MTGPRTWGNVRAVRPAHPGVEDVEESALEALFQRGMRMRLYLAPLFLMVAMSTIAFDPAQWRRVMVPCAIALILTRGAYEYFLARRQGISRRRLTAILPLPATMLLFVIASSGGLESPVFVMLPVLTTFLCLFLKPTYGLIFALIGGTVLWALTLVAYFELVPDLIPAAFGGGPRSSGSNTLLFTRAFFLTIALFWATVIGWVMRRAYQSAIRLALGARDDVLRMHEDSTLTLTTLAAEIAHELKNPLASVKGLAALVDREAVGKEKERLAVLRREVDRMQDILESFLNFSRPLVPLALAPVRLSEVVEHVVALYEGVARERGIELRTDAQPELAVSADERKLKQVLINLVQNALDVTPQQGAVDLVSARDGTGAKISVMDRGPGLDDPEQAFDPGVTSKKTGSGLGLTVARLIARQHGGDLQLLPRVDGGTVAELTLPARPPV